MPHDREANKASQREWYQRNKERIQAKSTAYYAEKKQDPDWYAQHLSRARMINLTPERLAKKREQDRLRYHQKKAEKLSSDT